MMKPTYNIVYKTLGFKRLIQGFCPAPTLVSGDRYEARNPQRFIHADVSCQEIYPVPHDATNNFWARL